jgi:hypothetical protein
MREKFIPNKHIKGLRTKPLKKKKTIRETSLLTEDNISINENIKIDINKLKLKHIAKERQNQFEEVLKKPIREIKKIYKDKVLLKYVLEERKKRKDEEKRRKGVFTKFNKLFRNKN